MATFPKVTVFILLKWELIEPSFFGMVPILSRYTDSRVEPSFKLSRYGKNALQENFNKTLFLFHKLFISRIFGIG